MPDAHFAPNAVATIGFPESFNRAAEISRTIVTNGAEHVFFGVIFDEPQADADGDGPYGAAEIHADQLEPLDDV